MMMTAHRSPRRSGRALPLRTAAAVLWLAITGSTAIAGGPDSFVNWESPHVSPIDMTPDGTRLLAVNTADNRLEVFAIDAVTGGLVRAGSVPVGLDPVSVRARTDDEAWVVNHISDTISIVDLANMVVKATILTDDEPADVVFAGEPQRAFVSLSQVNTIAVYDPIALGEPLAELLIEGEDPRALATDGVRVYAAIFESGNGTTILDADSVSSSLNPYGGNPNPPPNSGAGFDPPIAGGLSSPPDVGLILKKNEQGAWMDDNGGDWSAAVTWDLHDHDVVIIEANSLTVSYVTGLMNVNMHLAAKADGTVLIVGTDATNHIRFEPNITGTFVRVLGASFSGSSGGATPVIADLNPHLNYQSPTVPEDVRLQSIGDPRGVAFNGAGDRAYVAGMGSSNLLVLGPSLSRLALVDVGQGPTGVRVNDARGVVYVLNRFEGTISVIDTDALTESQRVPYFDPTPQYIRAGRPALYDTHQTSGLGQASCASCHIDGRMDLLAWDLGDPSGAMKAFNQTCNFGLGGCGPWHPMKGPMTTQTLLGIIGTEPFHWRADREDLAAFNGAFESLMGDDEQLSGDEMADFEAFVSSLTVPPNPFRNLDGSLPSSLFNGGNPSAGANFYTTVPVDGALLTCAGCHALPNGTNGQLTSANLLQISQSMKIPQLRNMYEKTGFDLGSSNNNRGFGFTHDGAIDTLFDFLFFPGFAFSPGAAGVQQRRDVEAFLFCFATDTHAGVGAQATMGGAGGDQTARRDQLLSIANTGQVDLVAKGVVGGELRGYLHLGGSSFQSDRAGEVVTVAQLDEAAANGAMLTYTLVPNGSATRIGIDRDEDGALDRDELDVCATPPTRAACRTARAASIPRAARPSAPATRSAASWDGMICARPGPARCAPAVPATSPETVWSTSAIWWRSSSPGAPTTPRLT